MNYKHIIGIDISKAVLDFCLLNDQGEIKFYQCSNETAKIHSQLKSILKENVITKDEMLLCGEHTGHYGNRLCEAVVKDGYCFWLENPSQIKNSQGVQRGKDDKKDAERIALYAKRFLDKAVLFKPTAAVYEQLAYLSSERDLLVVDRAKYQSQLKDEKAFIDKTFFRKKLKRYISIIKELERAIKEIEVQIDKLIENDETLKNQYETIVSIDGIGKQVALHTIVTTEGFKKFTEARKFACHAGCAPFKYHSGSSIRSKNKVSHRANKKLKQLFHMAALSAIKMKGEMQNYFLRKVAEGKNKMTVINAVRGKLIARIFALIHQNRKYEKIYTVAIA